MGQTLEITTFDHQGDDTFAQDRPFDLLRPCSCGCDQRDNPDMVGYLHAVSDGIGFTITINDEEIYAIIEKGIA